jgi:hypothetical protein
MITPEETSSFEKAAKVCFRYYFKNTFWIHVLMVFVSGGFWIGWIAFDILKVWVNDDTEYLTSWETS